MDDTGETGEQMRSTTMRGIEPEPVRGRPVRRARESRDRGQILPLTAAFVAMTLLIVLVAVDVSALHLQRQELQALTDAAALDAADALDEESFYEMRRGGREYPVALSTATVRSSVLTYIQDGPGAAEQLTVRMGDPTRAVGATVAEVTLTGQAHVPLIGSVIGRWSDGVPLTATSRAVATRFDRGDP